MSPHNWTQEKQKQNGVCTLNSTENSQRKTGILYGAAAYIMWGILPLYWKMVGEVPSGEILAHRILWSFVFVLFILRFYKKWNLFKSQLKTVFFTPRGFLGVFISSILISANWFIYIWSVNSGHIIEASLGYYINPLISVILGMLVLKERLLFWQIVSFVLAGLGVVILTLQYGRFPWIAISLALSFGLYGLAKKTTNLDSMIGLTFETMIVAPAALVYLLVWGQGTFVSAPLDTKLLLAGAGIVTALPLLWFAAGAKLIPLSLMGFLQYIAPTMSLFFGVFLYHEKFTKAHLVCFVFIWTALTIYSLSRTKMMAALQPKFRKSKSVGV